MANKKLRIWCYDTESDVLYELYNQEGLPAAYDSDDRIVDARAYAENGTDILYFTDNYHEVRQLRCEIPDPYTAGFLSDYDLSLQRYGANGTIDFNTSTAIAVGGSLLSGTYQFAYRLIHPTKKVYTKWSTLTNPVHVYNKISSTYALYASGYGLSTDRKIVFNISPSYYEIEAINDQDLTHFQVAVLENVNPTATSLEASLLSVDQISLVGNSITYEYKANYNIGKISIDEIVVDSAALKTAKTLAVSQNRLFLGNVQYNNLEFDNQTPDLDGTLASNNEFITHSRENDINLELEKDLSFRKGYFRGEVYRFAIVYFDKYGNKSAPQVLDMTDVSGNSISGATDVKFPERGPSYPILNALDNPVNIGLKLKVKNHPSWAVGFEIVREKRVKKVLFQTPVIPMMSVQGVGALYTYPSTPTVTTGGATLSYSSAQPQDPNEVYVPKNLLWPELRNITLVTNSTGSGATTKVRGETQLTRGVNYNMAMMFPQENIYEAKDTSFSGSEQIKTVDYALSKVNSYDYAVLRGLSVPGPDGDYADQERTSTFYSLQKNFYHSNSGSYSSSLPTSNIVDSIYVENSSSGSFINGLRVMTYSDLQTEGYQLGFQPNTQRSIVCKLNNALDDEGSSSIVFPHGTHNAYSGGTYVVGSSGLKYTYEANYTNESIFKSGINYNSADYYIYQNTEDPVQVVRIANVINPNTGDDRYGDKDSQREFISTGTKYVFSAEELNNYITKKINYPVSVNVWGGDCCVTSHVFKIADSTYAVQNQNKHTVATYTDDNSLVPRWGSCYKITGSSPDGFLSIPVALKANAQYVQVFLESEYNGQALDIDFLNPVFASHAVKGKSVVLNGINLDQSGSVSATGRIYAKSNLTYSFNKNLIVNNDQKTYFTLPDGFNTQYDFGARIHYSDVKIYNSTNQGFDIFRVLDYYDLEESGGNITKLSVAGDDLYAIQNRRIVYLPVGSRQIETADSGILAVGTSSVLSQARIIDPLRGGQHLAGIVEAGNIVLIPDKANKAVYALSGGQIKIISDDGVSSTFRSKFGTVFVEKNLRGVYDPIRKEYWIFSNTNPKFCLVYNFSLEQWISNYEFDATLYGGRYTNQNLYLLGKANNQISVYSMYTGDYTNLMGTEVTPRVSFVVNPDNDYAKTFDDVMISATERLENIDFIVDRELSMGDQTVSEVNLDVFPVEGNYRIKTLRDPRNERLRGVRMRSTARWKKNNIASTISAIYTKYRLSSRTPF